uniref:Uncharacterized protein n=1 Tax=Arundo donax TaxID=35708 RepID=A0A0A9G4K2_ARUDO
MSAAMPEPSEWPAKMSLYSGPYRRSRSRSVSVSLSRMNLAALSRPWCT